MRPRITGNSHVAAIARAGRARGTEYEYWPLGNGRHESTVFSEPSGDGVGFVVPEYSRNLERTWGSAIVEPEHLWGFVQINHTARIFRHSMWRSMRPAELRDARATPLSAAAIRAVVSSDHHGVRLFYTQLQQAGVEFVAISAPPPRRDHPAIVDEEAAATVAVIDRVSRELWAEWLEARGIPSVDPPDVAADDDGFLLTDYAQPTTRSGLPDAHHANEAYGTMMLPRMDAAFRRLGVNGPEPAVSRSGGPASFA